MEGGACDSHTDLDMRMIAGHCRCKPNVKGIRCDDCKEGYYGLSHNDPLGCQRMYAFVALTLDLKTAGFINEGHSYFVFLFVLAIISVQL